MTAREVRSSRNIWPVTLRRTLLIAATACLIAFLVSARWSIRVMITNHHEINLTRGRIHYEYGEYRSPYLQQSEKLFQVFSGQNNDGISLLPDWHNYPGRYWFVSMPLWIPLLLFAGPAIILWRQHSKRVKPGHCRACGYDLQALKRDNAGRVVCPECGRRGT